MVVLTCLNLVCMYLCNFCTLYNLYCFNCTFSTWHSLYIVLKCTCCKFSTYLYIYFVHFAHFVHLSQGCHALVLKYQVKTWSGHGTVLHRWIWENWNCWTSTLSANLQWTVWLTLGVIFTWCSAVWNSQLSVASLLMQGVWSMTNVLVCTMHTKKRREKEGENWEKQKEGRKKGEKRME